MQMCRNIQISLLCLLVWEVYGMLHSEFHIIVALDGSGNFTKISDAVNAAPNYNKQKYTIKIKAGTYTEHVFIGKEKTDLVFIGEGKEVTISTFNSARVEIDGEGFIAKYITFNNSAGPSNGQAVALKSSSMHSAFYLCRFEGYQDTLLVDRGIQFYKECEIYGTVDLIFGNAKVVFQNCDIYVHNPGGGHSNVITAQGRKDPSVLTGISIQYCKIRAAKDFNSHLGIKTYLGRPWRPFSTVVVMQSFLDDIIDPQGWLQWNNDTSSLTTLYYGEYENYGPGANTSGRVSWKGYKVMNSVEAKEFTVRKFILGQMWPGAEPEF